MIPKTLKTSAATLMVTATLSTPALAGGYGRGAANLDPLLDDSDQFTTALTHVAPSRGMESVDGRPAKLIPAGPSGTASAPFTASYSLFGATLSKGLTDNVRCAVSFAQPYGSVADYGWTRLLSGVSQTTSSEMTSKEFGLTCAHKTPLTKGALHLIGGVFHQSIDYEEVRGFGFGSALKGGDITMEDGALGYRLGLGYTLPELALKASLTYRSEVDHGLQGVVRNPAFPTPGKQVLAFANAKTPQSLKLAVQSGLAPGWLGFGSVEWTDWSVLQQVRVSAQPGQLAAVAVPLAGVTVDAYFRDGWTVTGGVGHAFSDAFFGTLSLTWDKGVSTGRSLYSDTLSLGAGASYTINKQVSISGRLAYSVLDALVETNAIGKVIRYGKDHSVGGSVTLNVKF